MKVENPCQYYINGNKTLKFNYIPGDKIFQATFRGTGYIAFNALIFANDEKHVLQILTELAEFRADIAEAYLTNCGLSGREDYNLNKAKSLLAAIKNENFKHEDMQLTITEAPKNQLYKISWASNDNLL